MTITREQVADLQPGDVVQFRFNAWPGGTFIRGPLASNAAGALFVAGYCVRADEGSPPLSKNVTLTVLKRKPRPLYVNHPRTEPAKGDVVIDGEGVVRHVYGKPVSGELTWWSHDYVDGWGWTHSDHPPEPLRLLVDGETRQVVQ